jgi:hypothetical protein
VFEICFHSHGSLSMHGPQRCGHGT